MYKIFIFVSICLFQIPCIWSGINTSQLIVGLLVVNALIVFACTTLFGWALGKYLANTPFNDELISFPVGLILLSFFSAIASLLLSVNVGNVVAAVICASPLLFVLTSIRLRKLQLPELFLGGLVVGAVMLWTFMASTITLSADYGIVFNFWGDSFPLAILINRISEASSIAFIEHPRFLGAVMPPYHIGAYIIGGFYRSFSFMDGLDILNAVVTPLWMLSFLLVVGFVLSLIIRSHTKGLLAALLFVLLPNAYGLGFGNNYLGWHFTSFISPTLIAGLTLSLLAMSATMLFQERRKKIYAVLCVITILFLSFFKAHLVVFLAPFLAGIFVSVLFNAHTLPLRLLFASIATCSSIFFYYLVSSKFSWMPGIKPSLMNYAEFHKFSSLLQQDNVLYDFLKHIIVSKGSFLGIIGNAFYIILFCFGVYPFILIAGHCFARAQDGRWWILYSITCLMLAYYVLFALFVGVNSVGRGTPDELIHRPFALVYVMIVGFVSLITVRSLSLFGRNELKALAVLFASLFAIAIVNGPGYVARVDQNQKLVIPLCEINAYEFLKGKSYKSFKPPVVMSYSTSSTFALAAFTGGRIYFIDDSNSYSGQGFDVKARVSLYESLGNISVAKSSPSNFAPLDFFITQAESGVINEIDGFAYREFSCGKSSVYTYFKNSYL